MARYFLSVVLCTVVLTALLTLSACSPSSTSKHLQAHLPTRQCGTDQAGFLLLYSATSKESVRCIEQGALDASGQSQQQQVTSPVAGVYKICAYHRDAYAEYDSTEDPTPSVRSAEVSGDALGSIGVFVRADTCETVLHAIGENTMEVTDTWIDPCFCGIGSPESDPQMPIHQVRAWACETRSDFFTVIYDGGKRKACYANAGILKLSRPLTGVVRVCSGANTGDVSDFSSERPETGIDLRLGKMHACEAPSNLLHETEITITMIALDPVPLA